MWPSFYAVNSHAPPSPRDETDDTNSAASVEEEVPFSFSLTVSMMEIYNEQVRAVVLWMYVRLCSRGACTWEAKNATLVMHRSLPYNICERVFAQPSLLIVASVCRCMIC
jgi:hypothetical protein